MKSYVCYSLKMANFLANRGCHMSGTGYNKNAPWLNVFYFNDNDRTKLAVQAYYESLQQDTKEQK